MAKEYTEGFYTSKAWEKCRDGYMSSKQYICERCGEVASICHHKDYISPANIDDPFITLNWDNLEALCMTCHNREHQQKGITQKGLTFDKQGNLIQV